MSSERPKSTDVTPASNTDFVSQATSSLADRAVETFEFEVSAGNSKNSRSRVDHASATNSPHTDLSNLESRTPQPTEARETTAQQTQNLPQNPTDSSPNPSSGYGGRGLGIESQAQETIAKKPAKEQGQQSLPEDDSSAVINSASLVTTEVTPELSNPQPQTKITRHIARQSSWWMTSLGVHVAMLLVLAFSTLAIVREEKLELYASSEVYEPIEEFQEVEFEITDELESLDEELSEPDPAELEDFSSELLVDQPELTESTVIESASEFSDSLAELSLADLGSLTGDISGGDAPGGDSAIGAGTGGELAKFFGTEVQAKRILYMLDNSGGMRNQGKFEALVSELLKSVKALDAKQEFYVIFYSDTVYPLFFPQGVRNFVRANERNTVSYTHLTLPTIYSV